MKTHLMIAIIFFNAGVLYAQILNPAWKFVGPKSHTQTGDWFRSGQIDDITVEPGNPAHVIVSSFFAGVWETTNYNSTTVPPTATWHILPAFDNYPPLGMGCNGIGAVTFRNSTELYVAGCSNVYKYDYFTSTWSNPLGSLPAGILINKIVFKPNNSSHIFLCTSLGLIKSTDAGNTWSAVIPGTTGWIHSMVFIEKSNPGTYFWYIAGQNTSGTVLLKESANGGNTWNDMTTYSSMFLYTNEVTGYPNSFAGICLGNQTAVNGDRDLYISTAVSINNWTCYPVYPTDCYDNDRLLHRFTRNISNNILNGSANLNSTGGEYCNGPWRLVIGYDGHVVNHERVITGGVSPHAFKVSTNTTTNIGTIHDDYHAIYINTSVSPVQIFLGTDGGFASYTTIGGGSYTEHRLNYGLDISLINGFSGATEHNRYVYGQQDELYSGLYDEDAGMVIAWHYAGENDGGLIDKFHNNDLIISDNSSYDESYFVSVDGLNDFMGAAQKYQHPPANQSTCLWDDPPPYYYFEPSECTYSTPQVFGLHPFFQEPFREDRIYAAAKQGSLFQFDPISDKFVWKVRLSEDQQHYTLNFPAFTSSDCPGCPPDLGSPTKELHYLHYDGQPVAVSFSQLDKNIMYLVVSGSLFPSAAQVVQYIGNDRDDIWLGHNELVYNGNNPQWQLITPDWLSAPFSLLNPLSEIKQIQFTGVETSNWDKNKIYVSCAAPVLNPPLTNKVIIYDRATATWSDYSNGIPPGEFVSSMIMDHASNDGIYISTEKGKYYREPNMTSWQPYSTGANNDLFPFIKCTQMEINYRENSIRASTYGRGIWKSPLVCPSTPLTILTSAVSGYTEADDISTLSGNNVSTAPYGPTVFRATNSIVLNPGFEADGTSGTNFFTAFIHGCIGGSTSSYNYFRTAFEASEAEVLKEETNVEKKLIVHPNPTSAKFSFYLTGDEPDQILIYNSFGQVILNQLIQSEFNEIDLTKQPQGIYYVKVLAEDNTYTTKVIKR